MPTDAEWRESFKRVDSGKSSYRDEAKRLGTNPATFQRRYLDYLESRVGLVREEHAKLENAVVNTKEKLGGLTGKYEKKDQELTGEYTRKGRAAEAEFQSTLGSLKAKLAREETKSREILTKKEQEGKRRLDKIDAELRAKDAIIVEFKKRGLEPTRGLELLKRHKDLRGEFSRMEGLLKNVSASIDERRKQQRKEESDTASKRETALKMWDATLTEKRRQEGELDRQIREKKEHWGELGTKLRFAGQLLQHNQVENQHWEEKISNQLTHLNQLSDQVKELGDAKSKLNAEVQGLVKGRDALEKQNADLKKTSSSLEKRNAWLGESNTNVESMLNQYLLGIDKVKAAEIKREVQMDAEFNERKSKINWDIEKYTEGAVEKARKIVREKIEEMAHETHEEIARRNEFIETSRIRIISLATQLEDSEGKLKSEVAKAKGLEAEAKTRAEDLRGKLESLKGFKVKFVNGRELTLEQTRLEFISAYADEIKNKTEEKYQGLKSDYEAKMPQLVYKKLVQILEKPLWPVEITDAINDKARMIADVILRNSEGWPSWFKEYYRKEVSTRLTELLDDKFNERVDRKSQEVATEKLEILKSQAWPDWFSKNVRPTINENVFKTLKGAWTDWTCDKCGTKFGFTLVERDIGEVLRNGEIEFPCPNANCVDYGLLGWRSSRHKIKIPLANLIARLTEKIEIALVPVKKAASVA